MAYLHITLFATIIFGAAVTLPSLGGLEASRTLNTLATPLTVVSPRVEEAMAAPNPCTLRNVFCPNKRLMRVTQYGWTGNRMANGEYPYMGAVATSDRSIPLGTRIEIDGTEYTVADRTALWVHDLSDTIDIYSENPKGLSYKVVYFK